MRLFVMPDSYAVCRLEPAAALPPWATAGGFFAVTRTDEELSIVCVEGNVPPGVKTQRGWRMLRLQGPIDFAETGVLAGLAQPLAQAGISIFALSTFDTDYLLVPSGSLTAAVDTLRAHRFHVEVMTA